MPIDIAEEPERVLDPAIRVIEAGPGSGKTRALVSRFLNSANSSSPRRGVALLSFTNAAIDEVKRRTVANPGLVSAPNFVGTIDTFLHRFIVTPVEVQRLGRLPSYRASWDDLPPSIATVRLYGTPGAGIQLRHFRMDQEGNVLFAQGEITWVERQYLGQLTQQGKQAQLVNRAGAVIRGLNKSGVYDANTARVAAFAILQGSDGEAILGRLAIRFAEFLVDEAQDCDAAEFSVIRRLAERARSVVVADPDQAIFGFRGGDPQLFLAYRDEQLAEGRGQLSINHRSSKSICCAVSALRVAAEAPIHPYYEASCAPVFVLSGDLDEQRAKFLALLGENKIPLSGAMVLAHRRADAASMAGDTSGVDSSNAIGNRLATFVGILSHRDAAAVERLQAVEGMELVLLSLVEWPEELRAADRNAQLEALGRTPEWLRTEVAKLVDRLGRATTKEQFGSYCRDVLSASLQALTLPCGSLKNRVQKPSDSFWNRLQDLAPLRLRHGTIHGAKGSQFQAVLVALPSKLPEFKGNSVIDDWSAGLNTEPRRVLYVGASRAERLLAFGAGPHSERLAQLLRRANTPTELR